MTCTAQRLRAILKPNVILTKNYLSISNFVNKLEYLRENDKRSTTEWRTGDDVDLMSEYKRYL